jgi:23S rRNA G2445 N2-methylase RlmL
LRLASETRTESGREALMKALLASLTDDRSPTRKLAARALGKLGDTRAERPLLDALARASLTEQKSIVEALGLLGGRDSLAALAALAAEDGDLLRRRDRAALLLERRLGRAEHGALVLSRELNAPARVRASCRAGLAEILTAELRDFSALSTPSETAVELSHAGTLAELLVARTALEFGIVVELRRALADPADRIAEALTRPETLGWVQSWTEGAPRFRIHWSDGGHHRALAWAVAQRVRQRSDRFLNDSHQALWAAHVPSDASHGLWLVPRLEPDPRFAYRVSQVPAASHPTIAAALAAVAGTEPDEVVWDPFVGSAQELIERARRGPVRELWGSDLDPRALEAARANLDAAGFSAQLVRAGALELAPADVSLIVTNPPMGRRVARDGSLGGLLEGFVRHAMQVLRPRGRLVWLSPLAERTERSARAVGFDVRLGPRVDLGGFAAQLQVFTRPP